MSGGAGDDTYVVDNSGDVLVEQPGDGVDAVESTITFTLAANLDNLRLVGSAKISGTGNALDNVLIGNATTNALAGGAGNDWLDGGAGSDAMTGGAGDDVYVVDSGNDKTVEAAAGGYDTVLSSITASLSGEVERLFLTGSASGGTGNAANNWLIGSDAANTLDGVAGNDVLLGHGGNDTLQDASGGNALDGGSGDDALTAGSGGDLLAGGGGADVLTPGSGSDVLCLNRFDGADTMLAPTSKTGLGERNDTLSIGQARLAELAFAREGSDLLVQLGGAANSLRLAGWYLGAASQTVARLQWITDSSADYAPGSGDLLRNAGVLSLDFAQLAAAFDAARAANPALASWTPTDAQLAAARLGSSDGTAYGGALAYAYAHDGALDNLGVVTAADQLGSASLGSALQPIATAGGQVSGGVLPTQPFFASVAADVTADAAFASASSERSGTPGLVTIAEAASAALAVDSTEGTTPAAAFVALPAPPSSAPPVAALPTSIADAADVSIERPITPENAPPASLTLDGIGAALGGTTQFEATATSMPSRKTTAKQVSTTVPETSVVPVDAAWHDEATLFPASALMRASMTSPARASASPAAAAIHHARARTRLQWDAVDAWSALQQASLLPALQAGEAEWSSAAALAGLASSGDADTLDARPQAWEVKRFEQAARFSLAHLT
jgi:Ca2+-binding RTX toxin-like protein